MIVLQVPICSLDARKSRARVQDIAAARRAHVGWAIQSGPLAKTKTAQGSRIILKSYTSLYHGLRNIIYPLNHDKNSYVI